MLANITLAKASHMSSLKSRSRETPLFEKRSMKDFEVILKKTTQQQLLQDFLVLQVVGTLHFQCRGHRFDPWLGN